MTAGPALLVVGHPGHELMVHGWLEAARPLVMVLTDGSGHAGVSRLPSTAALLARAGATPGPIFGRFTDVELYRALLDCRTDVFADSLKSLRMRSASIRLPWWRAMMRKDSTRRTMSAG